MPAGPVWRRVAEHRRCRGGEAHLFFVLRAPACASVGWVTEDMAPSAAGRQLPGDPLEEMGWKLAEQGHVQPGLGELCGARRPWALGQAEGSSRRPQPQVGTGGIPGWPQPRRGSGARPPAGDSLGGEVLMAASFAPFPCSVPYRTLCSRRGVGGEGESSIHCEPKPGRKASREALSLSGPRRGHLPASPGGPEPQLYRAPSTLTQPPTGPTGGGGLLWTDGPPLGGPAHPTRPLTACTRVHGALSDSLGSSSACPPRAPAGLGAGAPGSSLGVTI